MRYHNYFSIVAVLCSLFLLVACGEQASPTTSEPNPTKTPPATEKTPAATVPEYTGEAVELLVMDHNTGKTDEQFEEFIVKPIQAKYPGISLTMTKEKIDALIAAGTPPDLVFVSNPSLSIMLDVDLPEDLSPMIKEYNIDLTQLDAIAVDYVRKFGDGNIMYGIPIGMNYGATIYNKDLFDKFGYDYPKDVMNYSELLELGRQLTREESGVNYIGVMPPDLRQIYWQAGIPIFDQETNKVTLTTDRHTAMFSLLKQFYDIPGYVENGAYRHSVDLFFKEHRMAMFPNWMLAFIIFFENAGTKDTFNWDLAAHPTYDDTPTFGKEVDFDMIVVNKASPHKKAAYQVVAKILTEEVQTMFTKAGRMTVMNDPEIQKQYAADSNLFVGKNLEAIFKVIPSQLPPASYFDAKINALLNGEVSKSVIIEGVDINTALRNAQEKAQKEIVDPELAAK